jgi:Ca2+-binding EF-hand superfamily protein
MAEADLNGDGALSAEEFVAQALRYFDAADVDGDGRIEKRDRKN